MATLLGFPSDAYEVPATVIGCHICYHFFTWKTKAFFYLSANIQMWTHFIHSYIRSEMFQLNAKRLIQMLFSNFTFQEELGSSSTLNDNFIQHCIFQKENKS